MVLLTVYYMVATGIQSWRLRSVYQKVVKVLDSKNSIVFLKNCGGSDGSETSISSDRCVNSNDASVGDCFWSNEVSKGLSVSPKQLIYLNPFVSFPKPPSLIPFEFLSNDIRETSSGDVIYTLIEAELAPLVDQHVPVSEVELFGELVAWRVDTGLALLLKTDARKFSQLILSTFIQNNYFINDNLPLVRIQTVNVDGKPQEFDEILKHSRKDIVHRDVITPENWENHVERIKKMSILANQAVEFEIKKNLTEGKTGIVQPDLISSKNIEESLLHVVTSPDTPKKKMLSLEKTGEKITGLKVELERQELLKSPLNQTGGIFPTLPDNGHVIEQKVTTPESPRFPTASPAKSPSVSVKSKISNEPQSPKFPTASPAKKPVSSSADRPSIVKMESKASKLAAEQGTNTKDSSTAAKKDSKAFIESEKTLSQVEPTKPTPLNLPPAITSEPQAVPQAPPKLLASKSSHSLRRNKHKLMAAKPPNILVYSDSVTTRGNVIKTLNSILQRNTYTIYPLTSQQASSRVWLDNASLLVVCGSVNGGDLGPIFLDFFFKGGKVLCLCSDLLRHVLPTYHTAEVREHELAQFSYGKWKNIKMMHHIFCYQPSPVRKNFSQDSDDPPKERPSSAENPLLVLLRSVELKDQYGVAHNIRVQTLGTEDTWKTPSLLMVCTDNGGKIVFSQIHLEVDPSLYENDDQKYQILMKNDGLRHEIFGDVLSSHLGLTVGLSQNEAGPVFTRGYFLGRHDLKFEVLDQLKPKMENPNTLKLDGLTVKFCGKNEDPPAPDAFCFPIMIHTCPDDFSTLEYFDSLKSQHVGRLLVYSKVLASSMVLVNKVKYSHGFAVIPRELTGAVGRGSNQWLSPPGCLMFSLQLHIPMNSPLGKRVPLLQHLVATSVVKAILNLPGFESLDIKLKWPNDFYANSDVKIGGLVVNSLIEEDIAICNVGLGINLSNSLPTTCINDLIKDYNKKYSRNLPLLTFEKTLALIFNEIESILDRVQSGDVDYLYDLYYKHWLHSGASINVRTANGAEKAATVLGIDDFGFLKIQLNENMQIESVQPDGNSFDMLRGLIVPK